MTLKHKLIILVNIAVLSCLNSSTVITKSSLEPPKNLKNINVLWFMKKKMKNEK